MLFWTGTAVAYDNRPSLDSPEHDKLLKNALLESYTVHLRNIVTFCYPYSVSDIDVVAHHFMPSELNWEQVRPALTAPLRSARSRTYREITHSARRRYTRNHSKNLWALLIELDDICNVIQRFIGNADRDRLAPKVFDIELPKIVVARA